MKGIMSAKKKPLDVKDAAALALDAGQVGLAGAKTRVLSGSFSRAAQGGGEGGGRRLGRPEDRRFPGEREARLGWGTDQ